FTVSLITVIIFIYLILFSSFLFLFVFFFFFFLFFFNDTATTEIYTLSLHDALPISRPGSFWPCYCSAGLPSGCWRRSSCPAPETAPPTSLPRCSPRSISSASGWCARPALAETPPRGNAVDPSLLTQRPSPTRPRLALAAVTRGEARRRGRRRWRRSRRRWPPGGGRVARAARA